MLNYPPLSDLPDFLPAGAPGSPERIACALGTFTNLEANMRLSRYLQQRFTQPIHSTPLSAPALAERAFDAP